MPPTSPIRFNASIFAVVLAATVSPAVADPAELLSSSAAGDLAVITAEIAAGTEVDARNDLGATPLILAAAAGHVEAVKALLNAGADPNARRGSGVAIQVVPQPDSTVTTEETVTDIGGGIERVETTTEFSEPANVEYERVDGEAALHLAAAGGHTDVVRVPLDHGADPLQEDGIGRIPIRFCASSGSVSCTAALIDASAPRTYDLTRALFDAAATGEAEIARLLFDAGAELDFSYRGTGTAIHEAAAAGHTGFVEVLLGAGDDPNRPAIREIGPPLAAAIRGGHIETVQALLRGGADPKFFDYSDETSLGLAAGLGDMDMVLALLDAGVPADLNNRFGESPAFLAIREGHVDTMWTLVGRGAKLTPALLVQAAAGGHADAVRDLLARGVDPDGADRWGTTALNTAANAEVASLLLGAGATLERRGSFDRTPLENAVEHNRSDVVQVLLDAGARPTDLQVAPSADIARMLVDAGAKLETRDRKGRTLLLGAADRGEADTVRFLLDAGADPAARDAAGRDLDDYAAGHPEVVAVIEAFGVTREQRAAAAPFDPDARDTIREVQSRLNEKGFDAGPADGLMGRRTRGAVTGFQQSAGIPATGEITSGLMRALRAD